MDRISTSPSIKISFFTVFFFMAGKAPALISAKKSDALKEHFEAIKLQKGTPLRKIRQGLRNSEVKGVFDIACSWSDSKLRKAVYRFFAYQHVHPVTLHRFDNNRVSIEPVDNEVFAKVHGLLDSIVYEPVHVLQNGPPSLQEVLTIVTRGDVINQSVFDQLRESNIISMSRTKALEHERQFQSRDIYSMRQLPMELAVIFYSSFLAHLPPHIDGTEGPTTIICVDCHPDDNDVMQSQDRHGNWTSHNIPQGSQATMSQQVYHRVTPVKHPRKVLVMQWCNSYS
jgi:hypothetical protein